MSLSKVFPLDISRYKLSRKGRKFHAIYEQKVFALLPKDVTERSWADIMDREDTDLMLLELREEILEEALQVCYDRYMERQIIYFTSFCTERALYQLLNWQFYCHDPGEDPSAQPLCFIPRRAESWIPDGMPYPSPKDVFALQDLEVVESENCEESLTRWSSMDSIEYPLVKPIPKKYWFPGKVCIEVPVETIADATDVDYVDSSHYASESPSERDAVQNEVLQKVIDYTEEASKPVSVSTLVEKVEDAQVETPAIGAGDSGDSPGRWSKHSSLRRSKSLSKSKLKLFQQRTMGRPSGISDCRLRSPRLDVQHEVTSEKDTEAEMGRKKKK